MVDPNDETDDDATGSGLAGMLSTVVTGIGFLLPGSSLSYRAPAPVRTADQTGPEEVNLHL